jgi:hypothetical protein
MKTFASLGCVVLCVAAIGCSADTGGRVTISGDVTLNGAPLETGTISFMPADGKGATAGATITAGKYETEIAPGAKKVSITAEKVISQRPRDPADPSGEQITETQKLIPPQYNDQTTLTVDVPATGKKDANFALTGTPAP